MSATHSKDLADERTTIPSVEDRLKEFKEQNPEVQRALELFNISSQHYEAAIRAVQSTRTYVTTSTLLPGHNG